MSIWSLQWIQVHLLGAHARQKRVYCRSTPTTTLNLNAFKAEKIARTWGVGSLIFLPDPTNVFVFTFRMSWFRNSDAERRPSGENWRKSILNWRQLCSQGKTFCCSECSSHCCWWPCHSGACWTGRRRYVSFKIEFETLASKKALGDAKKKCKSRRRQRPKR